MEALFLTLENRGSFLRSEISLLKKHSDNVRFEQTRNTFALLVLENSERKRLHQDVRFQDEKKISMLSIEALYIFHL